MIRGRTDTWAMALFALALLGPGRALPAGDYPPPPGPYRSEPVELPDVIPTPPDGAATPATLPSAAIGDDQRMFAPMDRMGGSADDPYGATNLFGSMPPSPPAQPPHGAGAQTEPAYAAPVTAAPPKADEPPRSRDPETAAPAPPYRGHDTQAAPAYPRFTPTYPGYPPYAGWAGAPQTPPGGYRERYPAGYPPFGFGQPGQPGEPWYNGSMQGPEPTPFGGPWRSDTARDDRPQVFPPDEAGTPAELGGRLPGQAPPFLPRPDEPGLYPPVAPSLQAVDDARFRPAEVAPAN